ncbi:hypothetical protein [Spirulina sp. 06S082]|uniref:hypothetical protein n=1 Tax=Spirulina sp. 06S082 TaxID=3110248 RepID=UPI002B1EC3B7|nr:hypothetical protein [Spirulina sp. 06S082]MEA5470479.1 hypothetical protein [Spirulina sp. 06S082]
MRIQESPARTLKRLAVRVCQCPSFFMVFARPKNITFCYSNKAIVANVRNFLEQLRICWGSKQEYRLDSSDRFS